MLLNNLQIIFYYLLLKIVFLTTLFFSPKSLIFSNQICEIRSNWLTQIARFFGDLFLSRNRL